MPLPTSPWSRRSIGEGCGQVGGDLGRGAHLAGRRSEGQGGQQPAGQMAVAPEGPTGPALAAPAGDGQGQLARQKLVEGKAATGWGSRGDGAGVLGAMQRRKGSPQARQVLLALRRLDRAIRATR